MACFGRLCWLWCPGYGRQRAILQTNIINFLPQSSIILAPLTKHDYYWIQNRPSPRSSPCSLQMVLVHFCSLQLLSGTTQHVTTGLVRIVNSYLVQSSQITKAFLMFLSSVFVPGTGILGLTCSASFGVLPVCVLWHPESPSRSGECVKTSVGKVPEVNPVSCNHPRHCLGPIYR